MTKYMTADLTGQHLATLNAQVTDGRAEVAPSLNSVEWFVQAWHDDYDDLFVVTIPAEGAPGALRLTIP